MKRHDEIAERLAKLNNTEYNRGEGADVVTKGVVIEVATNPRDIKDSIQGGQLDRSKYRKQRRYLAVTD